MTTEFAKYQNRLGVSVAGVRFWGRRSSTGKGGIQKATMKRMKGVKVVSPRPDLPSGEVI